jgi:hypothetical protein
MHIVDLRVGGCDTIYVKRFCFVFDETVNPSQVWYELYIARIYVIMNPFIL